MYYQSNRDRFRNIGNKSLKIRQYQQPGILDRTHHSTRPKFRTQIADNYGPDSLQLFQQQLNSAMKLSRAKRQIKKTINTADFKNYPSKQTIEIKNQVNELKSMLQSQSQLKNMQNKLEKLLVQLEDKSSKTKKSSNTQDIQSLVNPLVYQSMQPQMYMPQPMMYPSSYPSAYPPAPYYYPFPYSQHEGRYGPRKKKNRQSDDSEQSEDDENYTSRKKPKKGKQTNRSVRNPVKRKEKIKTRLRIYLFMVAFTFFLRSEAKKLSTLRKNNLKKFWGEKFESQILNVKNWFLDTQKFSLSIILQKKNLNLVFFDDKSTKVKQEKQKLIMQIVNIGINKMHDQCTPQKVSLFTELLLNLCRNGSFSVSRFWTVFEMENICVSQFYGFFRLDSNLQKYLIGILMFIKVFIFNMFLQPSKFDSKNFPKKEQPITTNMKILSSVYYHMIKQVINQYKNQERDDNIFKIGNWLQVKKQFIVECSQPLVYGNDYPEGQEYISGLFAEQQFSELKQHEIWGACLAKIKGVIQKLHTQMLAKTKMVKKNLKYKLYK